MGVHRGDLVLPRDQELFRVAHAAVGGEVGEAAISQREQEKAEFLEAAAAEVGDVPAAARIDDLSSLVRSGLERLMHRRIHKIQLTVH